MAGLSARRAARVAILWGVSTLVVGLPMSAGAQDVLIQIDLDTVVTGPEGSEHVLASEEVPDDLVGSECNVSAVSTNQGSVHPGNDLVISSNGDQLVLEDVEGEAFGERELEGPLTLGAELTVTLVLGPDGVFSAGMVVEVRCTATETTTTIGADTTTTTVMGTTTSVEASPTTVEETTTTSVPTSITDEVLPFTGTRDGSAATVALIGLMLGMGLIVFARRTGIDGSGLGRAGHTEVMIEGVRVRLIPSVETVLTIEGVPVRLIRPGG